MKVMFFDALAADDKGRGYVIQTLLEERGAGKRPGATAALPPEQFFLFPTRKFMTTLIAPWRLAQDLPSQAAAGVSLAAPTGQDVLVKLLQKQTEILGKAFEKKDKKKSSVIQVNPVIHWPKLGDDGPEARQITEFYEKFERLCGLANDGCRTWRC